MTKEEKLKRGKQILSDMKSVVNGYYKSKVSSKRPAHFDYYCNILHAVSEETHETPIPLEEMYLALAEAEEQGKKVLVEPDAQFVPDENGMIKDVRCDGWSYHLVIS